MYSDHSYEVDTAETILFLAKTAEDVELMSEAAQQAGLTVHCATEEQDAVDRYQNEARRKNAHNDGELNTNLARRKLDVAGHGETARRAVKNGGAIISATGLSEQFEAYHANLRKVQDPNK